jgi:hypothetical protein
VSLRHVLRRRPRDARLGLPGNDPDKRCVKSAAGYMKLDGTKIASDWADLKSGFVGEYGLGKSVDCHWTQDAVDPWMACEPMRRIYCFEQ